MGCKVEKPLKLLCKYKFTLVLLVLLIYVAIVLGSKFNVLHIVSALSFVALLIVLGKTKYSFPFFILLGLLITIDIYFALVFKARLNVGLIGSVFDTNPGEVQGAFSTMFSTGLPILIGSFGLLYLSKRELKKSTISRKSAIIFFSLYWFVFVPVFCIYKIRSQKHWDAVIDFAKPYLVYEATAFRFPIIYNNMVLLYVYLDSKDDFSTYATADREIPEGISYDENQITPQKIYLVIGESAWRNHLSLYGYDKKTTPFLDSLASNDTINLKYYAGIASATLTREVMKLCLSFATPHCFDYFDKSRNLVEMVRDANFKTYWISNQTRIGTHETSVSVMSATADYSYHETKYPTEDLDLVNRAKNELIDGKRQFFILHLDGSHIWYPHKYDKIDEQSIVGVENDTLHYDRTIHHTDRVLRELYHTANNDGSSYVILYFSDHGEIIGVGHGFMAEGTANLDIPFLTINNSQLPVDSIVSKYIDKETNTINNTNVVNIVSEFAGYKTTDEYVENAVEEGRYVYFPDMSVWLYEDLLKRNKQ